MSRPDETISRLREAEDFLHALTHRLSAGPVVLSALEAPRVTHAAHVINEALLVIEGGPPATTTDTVRLEVASRILGGMLSSYVGEDAPWPTRCDSAARLATSYADALIAEIYGKEGL